ncbi:MAG: hypothetical protein ACM3ON_12245 [Chloroflexota bacterium]
MGDLYLKDSKQRYHQVCIQSYNTSCGMACVAMTERIYKHLARSDETKARRLSQQYPGAWSEMNGSWPWNWRSVLNAEGVQTYKETYVGYSSVYSYLKFYAKFATPVIVGVQWYGGGGHAVLCAISDPDDIFVFFDPWYGLIEVAGTRFPYYDSPDGLGYMDGWLLITRH